MDEEMREMREMEADAPAGEEAPPEEEMEADAPANSGNPNNETDDAESQLTVGEFSIGFDADRIDENNSGFFVADNVDTEAILFDVSNPSTPLSSDNGQLSVSGSDLLVSPEFAAVLGDESLQGVDVGDTRIDATLESQEENTFEVESGVTSVFLDLPLLESAGLELANIDSEAEPFSDEFQAGFNINDETNFTLSGEEVLSPVDGTIEHDGTVTFDTEVAADTDSDDPEVEPPIDEDDSDNSSPDDDVEEDAAVDDTEMDSPVAEDDDSSGNSDFETIDLTDMADQTVEFTVTREAGFDNTIGFYEVDGDGSVVDSATGETIAVGEEGYKDAALANSLDFTLSADGGETSTFTTDIAGGTQYGTFIIADGGLDELLDTDSSNDPPVYFASAEANIDNFDHIRSAGSNTFEYEDLPNGMSTEFNETTPDFNDMVVEYDFV